MKEFKLYQNESLFLPSGGAKLTPQELKSRYEILNHPKAVVVVQGETLCELGTLDVLRGNYTIDTSLSDQDALTKINEVINKPDEGLASNEELKQRLELAEEALNFLLMGGM